MSGGMASRFTGNLGKTLWYEDRLFGGGIVDRLCFWGAREIGAY
jgi:hypothetical protein